MGGNEEYGAAEKLKKMKEIEEGIGEKTCLKRKEEWDADKRLQRHSTRTWELDWIRRFVLHTQQALE